MPDTGWYRHPYFTANRYNIKTPIVAVPGDNPSKDPAGHGTAQSANIFAVAPAATLQPIRVGAGSRAAFLKAKALKPQIITNSTFAVSNSDYPPTGGPDEHDLSLAAEIKDAIEKGILVIFAAGNGQFSVEPQVPGVLAAGGAYVDENGAYKASDMASGYQIFMVRRCGCADCLRSLRDAGRPEVSDAARSGWVCIGPEGEYRSRRRKTRLHGPK